MGFDIASPDNQRKPWHCKLRDVTAVGAFLFFVYTIGFAVFNFDPLHVSVGIEHIHRGFPRIFEIALFLYFSWSGWSRWRRYQKHAREIDIVLAVELWILSATTLTIIVL